MGRPRILVIDDERVAEILGMDGHDVQLPRIAGAASDASAGPPAAVARVRATI
jgi:hypothetical protein